MMIGSSSRFRQLSGLVTGFLLLALSGCASEPATVSSQDSAVDFSKFKTYAFLSDLADDKSDYQTLETTYLKDAVTREMTSRGFQHAGEDPDIVINFAVETQEKVRTRQIPQTNYGIGYDPYYDVYYDGWGVSHTTRIDQHTEGKLNIDVIDVDSRKLVWQGSTKGRITSKVEQDWKGTLEGAVQEIFTQFPVPAR